MLASLTLLAMTLLTATLSARLHSRTVRLTSSLQDANTQRQSVNAELHRRAFLDPLTDLPNHLLFEDRLQQALAKRKHGAKIPRGVAVLCESPHRCS